MNFFERNKIPLAILVGAGIIGVFVYFAIPRITPIQTPAVSSPIPAQEVSQVLSPTPTPTPTPVPAVDETAAIKQAVLQKLARTESTTEVAITQKTDTHAKGSIREKEAVGGGYFLAAKTSAGWVIVYDGQAQPTCSQIASYNFPKTMVSECLDTSGRVITR